MDDESPGHNRTGSDWAGSDCYKISQADGSGLPPPPSHLTRPGPAGWENILREILKYLNIPSDMIQSKHYQRGVSTPRLGQDQI